MYNLYHCFVIDLFHFGRPWETLGESMGESINYQLFTKYRRETV